MKFVNKTQDECLQAGMDISDPHDQVNIMLEVIDDQLKPYGLQLEVAILDYSGEPLPDEKYHEVIMVYTKVVKL